MKKCSVLFLLCIVSSFVSLEPSYIVHKNGQLIENKLHWTVIYEDVLCKFAWPACLGNKGALKNMQDKSFLESGNENAEEKLLKAELKKLGKEYEDYDITFIPDMTYELFCIWKFFSRARALYDNT